MADDDVQVQFGGEIEGFTSAVKSVQDKISNLTAPIDMLKGAFAELAEVVVAVFAVGKLEQFFSRFAELGEETIRTATELGVSTDKVQQLDFVAKTAGVSQQQLTVGMVRLQYALQAAQNPMSMQARALDALGLSAKQLLAVPMEAQLNLLADGFKRLHDQGVNPASLAISLLSRAGMSLAPVLDQGREGLARLNEEFQKTGGAILPQNIEALDALHEQQVGTSTAFQNLGATIAAQFSPAISGLLRVFEDLAASTKKSIDQGGALKIAFDVLVDAVRAVAIALAATIGALQTFWEIAKTVTFEVGEAFMGLGRIVKDVFTGNFGDITAAWSNFAAQSEARAKIMAANMAGIVHNMVDEIKTTISDAQGEAAPAGGLKAPALPNTAAIQEAATYYKDLASEAQKSYQMQTEAANSAYNNVKEKLASQLKLGQVTNDQEMSALITALNQRLAAETKSLNDRYTAQESSLAAVTALYPEGSSQWQAALDKQRSAYQQYTADLQKLDDQWRQQHQQLVDQTLQKDAQEWQSALTPITAGFNSQLRSLLAGTETWSQAMKRIFADFVIQAIEELEKLAVEKAALGLAGGVGGLGSAFGGGAGSSGVLGLLGGVLGLLPAFDAGSWSVPHDTLAMVHQNELIVPATGGYADQARSAIASGATAGGNGGAEFHFNGPVIGQQAWINAMMPQLARALTGYQALNPSAQ